MAESSNRLNSCGKTTLARLLAKSCDAALKELSATDSGIGQLREAFEEAKNLRKLTRRSVHRLHVSYRSHTWTCRKTIIFFDEIHRFNKAQQVSKPSHAALVFLIVVKGRISPIHRTGPRPGQSSSSSVLNPTQPGSLLQLIGATTENPSFKLNAALLSRCR